MRSIIVLILVISPFYAKSQEDSVTIHIETALWFLERHYTADFLALDTARLLSINTEWETITKQKELRIQSYKQDSITNQSMLLVYKTEVGVYKKSEEVYKKQMKIFRRQRNISIAIGIIGVVLAIIN